MIFNRCNPDSMDCEYFQTWTFLDICSKVNEKNQIWSNFYTSFEPPIVCPIDKVSGIGSISNNVGVFRRDRQRAYHDHWDTEIIGAKVDKCRRT